LSPIGRNAQYCCSRYNVRLAGFASIDKSVIWRYSRAAVSDDMWQRVSFIFYLLSWNCFLSGVVFVVWICSHKLNLIVWLILCVLS